jgi:hypothetical protein
VFLSATITGSQPIRYQWRLDGVNIPGATNTTLTLSNFQPDDVGTYSIFVANNGGFALGTNFALTGRIPLQITLQPVSRVVLAGASTNFTVAGVSSSLIRFQWRRNGGNLADATNATLTLTNIQAGNTGQYTAVLTDDFNTFESEPATLSLIAAPVRTLQPFNMTVVEGSTVTLSASANGTPPIFFRWQTNTAAAPVFATISNVAIFVINPTNSTIVVTNIPLHFNGVRFRTTLTNVAGQVATTNGTLTVLADADRDGLPDIWENGRPGFSINDASDGARDDDTDGMTNGEEYFAGTDPFDGSSYLKVALSMTNMTKLSFNAVSNRAYSVQFSDDLTAQVWTKLGDALTKQTSRVEVLEDLVPVTNRFYRVVLPIQP